MKTQLFVLVCLVYTDRLCTGADVCLQGWKYYNNTCYKIFTRDRTWASAREHCKWFQGGELAKLPKPEELIPENNKIIWIGLKYENNVWKWTDGTASNKTLSDGGNSNETLSMCGAYNGSHWSNEQCDKKYPFICQSSVTACLGPMYLVTPSHHCIHLVNTSAGVSWSEARENCSKQHGGDLAFIYSESDLDFLKNLSLTSNYWLGFQYDLDLNSYVWLDGDTIPADYLKPDPDFPCGYLMGNKSNNFNMTLISSPCTAKLKFICESASCATNTGMFVCEQDVCIEENKICDGQTDCSNGKDETNVLCGTVTYPGIPTFNIAPPSNNTASYLGYSSPANLRSTTDTSKTTIIQPYMNSSTEDSFIQSFDKCISVADNQAMKKCFQQLFTVSDSWNYRKMLELLNSHAYDNDTTNQLKLLTVLLDVVIEDANKLQNEDNIEEKVNEVISETERFVQRFLQKTNFTHEIIKLSQDNVELFVTTIKRQDFEISFKTTRRTLLHLMLPLQSDLYNDYDKFKVMIILFFIKERKSSLSTNAQNQHSKQDMYRISPVLSLDVYTNQGKLSVNHSFSIIHYQDNLKIAGSNLSTHADVVCGFMNLSARTWSTNGCQVLKSMSNFTTCGCNHTTNFAVLMQVASVKLDEIHEFALNIITYIGCSVSLLTQLITLTVFTCVGSLSSERVYVHRNLCFAIVAAQVSFLAGIKAVHYKIVCSCVALVLHYFYTAVFVWMLVEGLHLYSKVVQVFGTEKSRAIYYFGFGWGVPLVLVTISATADWDGYGTETSCWLSTKTGTIWAFVGPALAVILVNVVILWMVVRIVMSSAKLENNGEFDHIRAGVKGAMFLLPLLGLTWTFGLLAVNEDLILFQYLFAIFNSLQGFFIFLFHCVCNSEVRQALRRMRDRRLLLRVDFSSSNGSGTRTQSLKTKATKSQASGERGHGYQRKRNNSTPQTSSTQCSSRESFDNVYKDGKTLQQIYLNKYFRSLVKTDYLDNTTDNAVASSHLW